MQQSRTTPRPAGRPPRAPRPVRLARGLGVAALTLVLGACGGSAAPGSAPSGSTSSAGATSSAASPSASAPAASATADALTIDITMTGDSVSPNGAKIDARVGQRVVLHVTSDTADEVHAHTGGDGYELEVPAGKPTTGSFTLDSPGSFEVESHGREKVLAILEVR